MERYFSLKQLLSAQIFASAILSLAFVCTLVFPEKSFSQTPPILPCSIERGTIDAENQFTAGSTGLDYKISCAGPLTRDITHSDIKEYIDDIDGREGPEFVEGTSSVMIDIKGDTSEMYGLSGYSDAKTVILMGELTNSATVEDGKVIGVSAPNPNTNNGQNYDLNVENHATIKSQGNGRVGVAVDSKYGADIEFSNFGVITTNGNQYVRTGDDEEFPNRRSDAVRVGSENGDITVINESGAKITATGKAARGLSVSAEASGGSSPISSNLHLINKGSITTEGDGHEFSGGGFRVYNAYGMGASLHNSDGHITIENAKGATITTKGKGGRGITAWADGPASNVTVSNAGRITTEGGAWRASSEDFDRRAYGVSAHSDGGGDATATNSGMITTGNREKIEDPGTDTGIGISGTSAHALRSVTGGATPGTATVNNTGSIMTYGSLAHGMVTWINENDNRTGPTTAKGMNSGKITTHGAGADGATIFTPISSDAMSIVSIVNQLGGTIITNGTGSEGIEAAYWMDSLDYSDALGTAHAENHGTVTVNGDGDANFIAGVRADFSANVDNRGRILNGGDATVVNTGTVIAQGNGAVGLQASTHGTGKAQVTVTNGIVRAGAEAGEEEGKFGIGIEARVATESTADDPSDDVDVIILVSGSSAIVQAYGADNNDGPSYGYDALNGIAILADAGDVDTTRNGHSQVTVRDGATVSAFGLGGGYATMFRNGSGTLNVFGSSLTGNVAFESGEYDDILNVEGSGSIKGGVNFYGGDDTLTVTVSENQTFEITGNIDGLETLKKKGSGYARFGGNINFQGSTLNLDEGVLVIAGALHLGSGELIVKEAGKLSFEVTSLGEHGYVSAQTVHFEGVESDEVSVHVQLNADLTDEEAESLRDDIVNDDIGMRFMFAEVTTGDIGNPMEGDAVTSIKLMSESESGQVADIGTISENDGEWETVFESDEDQSIEDLARSSIPSSEPSSSPGSGGSDSGSSSGGSGSVSGSGSGGSGSGSGILGLGLLAVLLASFAGDDAAEASFGDYYFSTPESAFVASVDDRGMLTIRESGDQPYQMWVRTNQSNQPMHSVGLSGTGITGSEIGLSLYGDDDFYINASIAPNVVGEVESLNLATQGKLYSLSSGWQNDQYFAGVRLSHGEFDTQSLIDNSVVNSALISNSTIRNTQAQFRTGANWMMDKLQFTPSASIRVGKFDQKSHVAQSSVLTAKVPGFSQTYTGIELGLSMTSTDWMSFSDGVKWKPNLKFQTIRTDSNDVRNLTMTQSDKLGALSFQSSAGLRNMPKMVNSMSFGAKIKSAKSDQAEWKFGVAGIEADGEDHYAAMVGYRLKF